MATAIIPIVGSVGGKALSTVEAGVRNAVSSLVGFIDPGKARDAQRLARANLWYGWAVQGSLYAARMVLSGGNAAPPGIQFYTTKERGYYDENLKKLTASNPNLVMQARIAGWLQVPENPSADDIAKVTADLENIQAAAAGAALYPYGTAAATGAMSFTPVSGAPAPVTALPAMVTTANAPTLVTAGVATAPTSSKALLLIGGVVVALLALIGILESRK